MLIEGIEESSPPIAGRLVELRSLGLQLPLEVSAAHDDRAGVALNRRHSLEGKGAAVAAGVLAGAAHAAFGMVGHGVTCWLPKRPSSSCSSCAARAS